MVKSLGDTAALKASSYAEAAGLLMALREGIAPQALMRPLPGLRELS